MKFTTLNRLRAHSPCADGWRQLLAHLDKTSADDEPLPLSVILESNGLEDALWALRAVDDIDREARLFACDCAEAVAHLNTDPRVLDCIASARRFSNGEATERELAAARSAAGAATWAAGDPARYTAGAAAWSAARDAAWAAARAASRSAEDAREAEDAARAAAGDPAGDPAWAAAWAAIRAASRDASRDAQRELFTRYFC